MRRLFRAGGPGWWLSGFGLVAVLLIVAGVAYYRLQAAEIRQAKYQEIAAIAALKSSQIQGWRQERITDARTVAGMPVFARAVREWLRRPAELRLRAELREHLRLVQEANRCMDIRLVDPDGATLLSVGADSVPLDDAAGRVVGTAETRRDTTLGDLGFCRGGVVCIDVVAPILGAAERPLLLMRYQASRILFPLIQAWPTPSLSAETMLVRREGNDVVFLNQLRFHSGTALTMRQSLSATGMPATQAVLGRRGRFDGVDYRGVRVLADLRNIPGSPWFLVAKVDAEEILAEVRYRAGVTTAFVLLSVLLAGGATAYGLRAQRESERQKAEAVVRALAVRQEALLAAIPDIVMEVDRNKVYTWANSAGIRFFGPDAIGKEAAFYFEGEQDTYATVEPLFEGRQDVIYVESWQRRQDGERRLLAWWCRFLKNAEGQVEGALSSARDITEIRRQEQELREKHDEMARFTYTVSHDLKSPLVTIETFLGFLEKDIRESTADRVEQDLGYIRGAASKMSRLLDELLDLARVGRKANLPEDALLQTIVRDALSLVAGSIATRGVEVEVTKEPIVLHGDRFRLVDVFQNLVDNAVKFMGNQPRPRIEIGAETAGPEVVLFVRDNGSGIDPRHQSKVFGLFEKLDARSEGTGMGLALVRRIVELHGGRISAESAGDGQGSTFRFTLQGTRRAS